MSGNITDDFGKDVLEAYGPGATNPRVGLWGRLKAYAGNAWAAYRLRRGLRRAERNAWNLVADIVDEAGRSCAQDADEWLGEGASLFGEGAEYVGVDEAHADACGERAVECGMMAMKAGMDALELHTYADQIRRGH